MVTFTWPNYLPKVVQKYLQNCLEKKIINQAYLFTGQEGLGKIVCAKYFIKSLKCLEENSRKQKVPCNKCYHCRQVEKNIHPDIYYLTLTKNQKNISVEQVKKLQANLAQHPFLNGYKLAIIYPAETLHLDAANRLLKTLEEPSPKTVIILISHRPWLLPKTIISRCQIVKFLPLTQEVIFKNLSQQQISRKLAYNISALACGSPLIAEILTKNQNYQLEFDLRKKIFKLLSERTLLKQLKFLSILNTNKNFLEQNLISQKIILILTSFFRDLIYLHFSLNDKLINLFLNNELLTLIPKFSLNHLLLVIKKLDELKAESNKNLNLFWGLENFFIYLNKNL